MTSQTLQNPMVGLAYSDGSWELGKGRRPAENGRTDWVRHVAAKGRLGHSKVLESDSTKPRRHSSGRRVIKLPDDAKRLDSTWWSVGWSAQWK